MCMVQEIQMVWQERTPTLKHQKGTGVVSVHQKHQLFFPSKANPIQLWSK